MVAAYERKAMIIRAEREPHTPTLTYHLRKYSRCRAVGSLYIVMRQDRNAARNMRTMRDAAIWSNWLQIAPETYTCKYHNMSGFAGSMEMDTARMESDAPFHTAKQTESRHRKNQYCVENVEHGALTEIQRVMTTRDAKTRVKRPLTQMANISDDATV